MWERYQSWRERKRAQTLVENLEGWHETYLAVTQICRQALFDPVTLDGDIGEVLDRTDRKLFTFRSQMQEARREIRRNDEDLARRLTRLTEEVYHLRNQTARFLIRAQGAQPFTGGRATDENLRIRSYHRALEEAGYEGRRLAEALQSDSDNLWKDLQPVLARAQQMLS